jgi:DNA polymerase-4
MTDATSLQTSARGILHVDMDAFFASVEQRDRPELRGLPVLVGGSARRGVVCAASYEARPFGVRSAMPMAQALRRCPDAIVVSPRHRRYAEISDQVFAIFRRYTPLVEGLSLDEAFLDVSRSAALFGRPEAIAGRIRQEIRSELGLTASAGVAPCKFAAKIASDLNKPDGLTVVPADGVAAFLAPLPLERMWGVGKQAAGRLRAAGLYSIGDLAAAEPALLERLLGSWGEQVRLLARGVDTRDVIAEREAKSIGSEETFDTDLSTHDELERKLLGHVATVAGRLTEQGLWASLVRVKLKYADFELRTRQRQLDAPVMDTDSLFAVARELLAEFPRRGKGVRLIGMAAGALSEGPGQAELFEDVGARKRQDLERVVHSLRERFGQGQLTRAALLEDADE